MIVASVIDDVWNAKHDASFVLNMDKHFRKANFTKWLGVTEHTKMEFDQMMQHVETRLGVAMSAGATRFPGHELQDRQLSFWVTKATKNTRRGEVFVGRGKTTWQALIACALIMWEMISYRRGSKCGVLR